MSTTPDKALKQKVRYRLKKEGEALVIRKDDSPLGIHVVDAQTGAIVAHHCSIEGLAKELGI